LHTGVDKRCIQVSGNYFLSTITLEKGGALMWLEIGLVILGIVVLVTIVNFILRKLLKIDKEKKDFFSYDYINEQHRKIEQWVR